MYPTADLHERATLCLSCHAGNEDKFATHRIMGAGHPRLAFELDTFLALQPPHYQIDADYPKRKPVYSRTRVWVHGQLAAAMRDMQTLQGPLMQKGTLVPELALFDCHACHENPLHRQDWSRGLLTRLLPAGSVPFADGHLKMAILIARRLDDNVAQTLIQQGQLLQKSSSEDTRKVLANAGALSRALSRTIELADSHTWTREDSTQMLRALLQLGANGDCADYISAEQAVMATELLMIETDIAARHRPALDDLYRTLRNDDAYQPSRLRDQMAALASQISQ
jgi:hypothetical protein